MSDWENRDAASLVLYGPTGAFAAFARTADGWQETRIPRPGSMPAASLNDAISADELIELLRAPLGASEPDESGQPTV
jgi:hypothetical protein